MKSDDFTIQKQCTNNISFVIIREVKGGKSDDFEE